MPLPLPVLGTLLDAKKAFFELCIDVGRRVLTSMQEADREVFCGPKGKHDLERDAYRGGSVASRVVLGGREVEVKRLRARGEAGELVLPSIEWASNRDPLNDYTLSVIAAGASMRRYRRTLEPLPAQIREAGVSKSAVSRRFVALTTRQLGEFLSRPLGELDIRIVYIDGKVFAEHCLLIALGVQANGEKAVLGLREGATENARVVRALVADLVERGLPTERPLLFVIDGARALRRAIRDVFGEYAVVQRCQFHKRCNVIGHLPESMQASVDRALRDAYAADSEELATKSLKRLASSLEREHPGAAASLREGLDETLTVLKLGVGGALRKTLATTNPIENLNSVVERYTRNVKRWRSGKMIERWVAAALLDAEKRFRRVRGYRDLPRLISTLDSLVKSPERAKGARKVA
jgi:transposase-like protein